MSRIVSMSQRNWIVGIVVGVSLLVGFYVTAVAVAPYVPVSRDFDRTFYPAAKYVLAGEDPYVGKYEYAVYGQDALPDFFSPPWVAATLFRFLGFWRHLLITCD